MHSWIHFFIVVFVGELLRKKRREKDGHKDPLLSEISRLQEEVMSQIAVLRNEHEVAEKKRCELDKVALILGLQPTDKPRREGRASGDLEHPTHPPPPDKEKKQDRARSREVSPGVQASAKVEFRKLLQAQARELKYWYNLKRFVAAETSLFC